MPEALATSLSPLCGSVLVLRSPQAESKSNLNLALSMGILGLSCDAAREILSQEGIGILRKLKRVPFSSSFPV